MPIAVGKLRVLVATTNGPVEVLLLTEEDAAIGRCVACIGGTTETADIAAAYHAFVVRPTGIIESRFGHSCYRLDVSGRIDAGSSWQLGVLAAHGLLAAGRLAQENDTADAVLWATGSVRPVDLTVGAVSHVPEKLANSLDRLKQERAAGRRVLLAMPAANAAELSSELVTELATQGFEAIDLTRVQPLFDALAMPLPVGTGKVPVSTTNGIVAAALAVTPTTALAVAPRRRRLVPAVAAMALLLAVAGAATVLLRQGRAPKIAAASPQQLAAAPTVVGPARVLLVPEQVPFATTQERARIRDEYMKAPDYKALAASLVRIDFVSGQPTQEIADRAAMEVCEKSAGSAAKTDAVCDLYASGNYVVTRRSRPPMPPEPWIVRNPAIERPLVAAQVPLAPEDTKERLNKGYPRAARAKAVVLAPTGTWWTTTAQSSHDEAVRRSLERCGYTAGVACMVIGIDDNFVVPIPTLVKVVGFYRLEGLVGVKADARDELARRLADAPNAWNAIAEGDDANVGITVKAASERSAIDGALADCARHDHHCRIAVLGPFLVEATDQGQSPAPEPAPAPPPPPPPHVALVPDRVPYVSERDRGRIRSEYMAAPDYKALATSFTHMALITGQPSQDAADRAAMEACEKIGSDKADKCDLYASGNVVVTQLSRPPMPAEPWIVRNRAVEQPFVAAQIPMLDTPAKERIANGYPGGAGSKALVISTDKRWVYTTAQSSPDEAVRRSLERCGAIASSACMVVAVDNTFVIPIPILAKAMGIYHPEALAGVTSDTGNDVTRRLADAPNAWNAVAVGAGGKAGVAVGADSEQGALDGALADCARRDRDCRIAVAGPFLAAKP
jgi:hypothetical protein